MMHAGLKTHLATGLTTVARCWSVTRRDGVQLGFTDHDLDLEFDGLVFRADSGLSARALEQGTGLAVDNTEAVGALRSLALTDADIDAGRYDGAEVIAWLVNWADIGERQILFRGTLGEIERAAGGFTAELRGLTEGLNRPVGRVYQGPCSAILGDASCQVDLDDPRYVWQGTVSEVEVGDILLDAGPGFDAQWFERGRIVPQTGAAAGLIGVIKRDVVQQDGFRRITLWSELRAALVAGDQVRIEAGCDKRFDTCIGKFGNVVNFQGFPDIPSEDWVAVHPSATPVRRGGSLR